MRLLLRFAMLVPFLPALAVAGQPYAFVTSTAGDAVAVVDAGGHALVGSLPVGSKPAGAALSPDGSRLYVALAGSSELVAIDLATGTLATVHTFGAAPAALALDPAGQRAYAVLPGSDSLAVVDLLSAHTDVEVPVGNAPVALAVAAGRAYVANWGDGTISVVDTAGGAVVVGTVAVGKFPAGLALDPAANRLYVANFLDDSVSVVNTATLAVVATIPVGAGPRALALDPTGARLYAAGFDDAQVTAIETATNAVVAQAPSGAQNPTALVVSPNGERLFVAHLAVGKSVTVLDTNVMAPISAIEAPAGPVAIAGFAPWAPPLPGTLRRGLRRLLSPPSVGAPLLRLGAPRKTALPRAPRGSVVIGDTEFALVDWEIFSSVGTQTATHETSGGNPGAWRRMEHQGGGLPVEAVHRFVGAGSQYDPATQGAIATLDAAWDRRSEADAGAFEDFVVVQGSASYRTFNEAFFDPPAWVNVDRVGLTATDFDDGSGGSPDFSAAGAPLTFGYYRRTPTDFTVAHGIDNFSVTVHPAGGGGGAGVLGFERFADCAGSAIPLDVTVERRGGTQGAVGVQVLIEAPDGATGTQSLSWADGDGAPKTFSVTFTNTSSTIRTADLTLQNPTGGATIDVFDDTLVVFVTGAEYPPELQALLLFLETLFSSFSPLWLAVLAIPAAAIAARRRFSRSSASARSRDQG